MKRLVGIESGKTHLVRTDRKVPPVLLWKCQDCLHIFSAGIPECPNCEATMDSPQKMREFPDVKGTIPVVLYLKTQEDVDELIEAFKQVKPSAICKQL